MVPDPFAMSFFFFPIADGTDLRALNIPPSQSSGDSRSEQVFADDTGLNRIVALFFLPPSRKALCSKVLGRARCYKKAILSFSSPGRDLEIPSPFFSSPGCG